MAKILREEGFLAFWKGNGTNIIRIFPYSAAQLMANDFYKRQLAWADGRLEVWQRLTAGACAWMTATAITHPLDTLRLRLALPESGAGFYPGMLVKVDVPVAAREALWIPAGAVFHHSELTAVFVLDDQGRPRLRQIRTGVERDGRLEVLAGLDEGEQVATTPDALFGSERLTVVDKEKR